MVRYIAPVFVGINKYASLAAHGSSHQVSVCVRVQGRVAGRISRMRLIDVEF